MKTGGYTAFEPLRATSLLCAVILLSACTGSINDPAGQDGAALLQQDRENLKADHAGQIYLLSLDEAINQALRYNLDLNQSALEAVASQKNITVAELQALPNMQATGRYIGRSNEGASSSRSVDTGNQSLVPSISSEQHRRVYEYENKLNLLDMTTAIIRSKTTSDQAKIKAEQTRKLTQTISRDVTLAYQKAYIAQTHLKKLKNLQQEGGLIAANIQQAQQENLISAEDAGARQNQISGRLQRVSAKHQELELAADELKTLLNLPLSARLKLEPDKRLKNSFGSFAKKSPSIEDLESLALLKRPELKEQILNQNIAVRDARLAVIETFPGAELLVTYNYDSNLFLENNKWRSVTASLVQSITKILTLPARYGAAKSRIAIEEQKRTALVAAVLAQVNISRNMVDYAYSNYRVSQDITDAAANAAQLVAERKKDGMSSQEQDVNARMEAGLLSVERDMAALDLQRSYTGLLNAIGVSVEGAWLDPKKFKENVEQELQRTPIKISQNGGAP